MTLTKEQGQAEMNALNDFLKNVRKLPPQDAALVVANWLAWASDVRMISVDALKQIIEKWNQHKIAAKEVGRIA